MMRPLRRALRLSGVAALALGLTAAAASAASCGNDASGFDSWLASFRQQAAARGISERTLDAALSGVTYDRKTISLDRGQRSFKLSFEQFYAKRVSNAMIARGRSLIKQHAQLFDSIEKRYGVPPAIIVAIWGLETGYGRDKANFSIIRSLATLAYDCRRSEFFRNELMAALQIVERGDKTPAQMTGGWAGEIGQTQFLASSYVKYAVDYDGNGKRDLVNSVPDLLASTANFLKAHGWQRGQSWGPGTANYEVIRLWNKASVYVQTISVMASKIAGNSGS